MAGQPPGATLFLEGKRLVPGVMWRGATARHCLATTITPNQFMGPIVSRLSPLAEAAVSPLRPPWFTNHRLFTWPNYNLRGGFAESWRLVNRDVSGRGVFRGLLPTGSNGGPSFAAGGGSATSWQSRNPSQIVGPIVSRLSPLRRQRHFLAVPKPLSNCGAESLQTIAAAEQRKLYQQQVCGRLSEEL